MSITENVARKFLARQQELRLDPSTRQKANKALRRKGFDGNDRFKNHGEAINVAFSVLADFGIESDEVIQASRLRTRGIYLAFSNPDDPFSPVPISNSVLHFSWTEMDNGRYEVIAYLS
jgi:hypothetical protein